VVKKLFYCRRCDTANILNIYGETYTAQCVNCSSFFRYVSNKFGKETVIDGKYQIIEVLNNEHNNCTYISLDLISKKLVRLRIFNWEYSFSVSHPQEFLHVNEKISILLQPGSVKIVDWGIENNLIYIVYSCEKVNTIKELLDMGKCFNPSMAVFILRGVALCLSKAKDQLGIGHYALSPNVIGLDANGNPLIYETGFAAQLFHDDRFISSGVEFYDSRYQSPEVELNWNEPDLYSDMYSLAMCLYSMVTGDTPLNSTHPISPEDYEGIVSHKYNKLKLSKAFWKLFTRLISKESAKRFNSWSDVTSSMNDYLQDKNDEIIKESYEVSNFIEVNYKSVNCFDIIPNIGHISLNE